MLEQMHYCENYESDKGSFKNSVCVTWLFFDKNLTPLPSLPVSRGTEIYERSQFTLRTKVPKAGDLNHRSENKSC